MTLKEQVATTRVVLALEGFTGIFDNELTVQREFWLRGRCGYCLNKGPLTPLWLEPNPHPLEEDSVQAIFRSRGIA